MAQRGSYIYTTKDYGYPPARMFKCLGSLCLFFFILVVCVYLLLISFYYYLLLCVCSVGMRDRYNYIYIYISLFHQSYKVINDLTFCIYFLN